MATVTIYADEITNQDIVTIQYDKKYETSQETIEGYLVPSEEGVDVRDEIIQEYQNRGYTFDGEFECALYFTRDVAECDFSSRQQEIDELLDEGWEVSETNLQTCQLTFSKSGLSPLTIQLDSTVVEEDATVNGDFTADTEETIIDGEIITTTNEQDLIDNGYTYEGIVDCKKTWSKEINFCEFDNKLKTIAEKEKEGYSLTDDSGCELRFEGTFEECRYPNLDLTVRQYEAQGYALIDDSNCTLHFQKQIKGLTNTTDVYAFFDTTSMEYEDGLDASAALKNWFALYQTDNPDYKGSLYIIPIYYERYVDYLDVVKNGTGAGKVIPTRPDVGNAAFDVYQRPEEDWIGNIGIYPHNFDYVTAEPTNPDWTPPQDVLMLAFMDEANSDYHPSKPSIGFTGQPTDDYIEDLNRFQNNIDDFNFFKGVLYPIVKNVEGEGGALVLQAVAAIEGGTPIGIDTTVDLSPLYNEGNPYTTPLKDYGWVGVYDKTSPASDVFNSSTFSNELTDIIESGSQGETQVEDVYVEGEIVQYDDEVIVEGLNKTKTEYIYVEGCEIGLDNEEYFEDASWTIAYSPIMGSWISYYSFVPNYYVNLTDHFKTGLNSSSSTMWSHLLTNKSYQVFYGQKQPWIVETIVQNEFAHKTLKHVEYRMSAKKYSGDYDFAEIRNEGFNKSWLYNDSVNSGELHLKPQLGLLSELSDYPNTVSPTQQEILFSDHRGTHRFNYFYDRIISTTSTEPMWKWDMNQIMKYLNENSITFTEKSTLDLMKGHWFIVRLQQDDRTDLRYTYKWMVSNTNIRQ